MQKTRTWFLLSMGMLALCGVFAVYVVTRPCDDSVLRYAIQQHAASSCADYWLNRYQQLITGLLSLAAALIAAAFLWRQIAEARRQSAVGVHDVLDSRREEIVEHEHLLSRVMLNLDRCHFLMMAILKGGSKTAFQYTNDGNQSFHNLSGSLQDLSDWIARAPRHRDVDVVDAETRFRKACSIYINVAGQPFRGTWDFYFDQPEKLAEFIDKVASCFGEAMPQVANALSDVQAEREFIERRLRRVERLILEDQ